MELKSISFCDKNCYNICSNDFKKKILDEMYSKYRINFNQKNLDYYDEKTNKYKLSKNPYLVSVKSIGNSYYLYLTKISGVNSCFFIDNKILNGYSHPRIIYARYRFSDEVFNGTLFQGELVKTANSWKFIIGDILVYNGKKNKYRYA